MQREIKFRAWDKRKMIPAGSCQWFVEFDGTVWINKGTNTEDMLDYAHDCILMQYTGLKDKNGKEIYEGDILKGVLYGKENVQVVEYSNFFDGDSFPCAGYYFCFDHDYDFVSTGIINDVEVIGNIYENPELLK